MPRKTHAPIETKNEKRNRFRREQRAEARERRESAASEFNAAVEHAETSDPPVEATPLMLAALDFERACAQRDAADVAVIDAEEALERAKDVAETAHTSVRGFRSQLASAIGTVDKLAHEAIK